MDTKEIKLPFIFRSAMLVIVAIIFAVIFGVITIIMPADVKAFADEEKVMMAVKYILFGGLPFALLSLIGMYVAYGILGLVGLKKNRIRAPLIISLGFIPWLIFGYNLVYLESRYTLVAKIIIDLLGKPLLYAGAAATVLGAILLIAAVVTGLIRKK
jgi:hypothetical protein